MRSSKMSLKSKNMIFDFRHFLLGLRLGFNLVKTPQRLGNWFQRHKPLKDWTNNKKQKKLSALFGCILKKQYLRVPTHFVYHITYKTSDFFQTFVFRVIFLQKKKQTNKQIK